MFLVNLFVCVPVWSGVPGTVRLEGAQRSAPKIQYLVHPEDRKEG